jgi:glycosyltransferase involved in cell wall biosynthesis
MGKTLKPVRKSLGPASLKVAVVITVFNEQDNILELVTALRSQTFKPAEVVIVDGGSTDQTHSLLRRESKIWPILKIFRVPGNRSVGRNYGVAHSSAPIIAFTDAGCTPHPDWLEQLVAAFSDSITLVVSGYYEGQATNDFQKALIPYVLVMPDKAGKTEFFPSTRSMALRRSVWNNSGGFDVRFNHNEDYVYAHWLKKMGYKFVFAPKAIVSWHPRKNLSQAAWMFLRFAVGDMQSRIFRPKVRLILLRYLLFAYLVMFAIQSPSLFYLVFAAVFAYLSWAVVKNYRYVKSPAAFYWLPVLQVTSDLMIIVGTVMGFLNKK